jgi:cysteine desulfurase/selenocysteine lyase
LWGQKEALDALEPLIVGGGTVDRVTQDGYRLKKAPYAFEAGTPNIGGVIGLGAAIDFLSSLGMDEVSAHEERLASTLAREFSSIPGMKLLHAEEGPRLAVGTLVPEQPHLVPDETMLRSGFFCAHPLFDALGAPRGGLRASAYVYNTVEELAACAENLRRVLSRWVR